MISTRALLFSSIRHTSLLSSSSGRHLCEYTCVLARSVESGSSKGELRRNENGSVRRVPLEAERLYTCHGGNEWGRKRTFGRTTRA